MKHGAALQKSLAELEALDNTQDLTAKIKTVNERATLFRISSNAMINVSVVFLFEAVPSIILILRYSLVFIFFRGEGRGFVCLGLGRDRGE
ncbi:oxysterol-binding protein 1-like [Penaeus monodon]|uniref:oxysterol-binding protein 1-like n=1 Tax=Penaeus monodon TaxID=6687 RepID=UPI0018A75F5A|nr:oxysterol-binding protein 1-like [Penaeus monodon]